jgi:hypothetical protein
VPAPFRPDGRPTGSWDCRLQLDADANLPTHSLVAIVAAIAPSRCGHRVQSSCRSQRLRRLGRCVQMGRKYSVVPGWSTDLHLSWRRDQDLESVLINSGTKRNKNVDVRWPGSDFLTLSSQEDRRAAKLTFRPFVQAAAYEFSGTANRATARASVQASRSRWGFEPRGRAHRSVCISLIRGVHQTVHVKSRTRDEP